jgi:biotin carboxyl carrier protein
LQFEIEVAGQPRRVTVNRTGGGFAVAVDGRTWSVDAARIDGQTLSLLVGGVSRNGDTPAGGGDSYEVAFAPGGAPGRVVAHVGPTAVPVTLNGRRRHRKDEGAHGGDGPQRIVAPMPGKVVRVLVKPGDEVVLRQPLVVVEAMKMENELRAGRPGLVAEVHVVQGASVEAGAPLIVIR